jgi:hypothetical protein
MVMTSLKIRTGISVAKFVQDNFYLNKITIRRQAFKHSHIQDMGGEGSIVRFRLGP